jgi:ABC-type multidrug transport system permease subunit
MYRVSPFTYLVSAVLSTGLSGSTATCSDIELLKVNPPKGQTCVEYLGDYVDLAQAKLFNGNATSGCEICSITSTDQFLLQLNIKFSDHWRNIGLLFVYIGVNILGGLLLYWLARVPKKWSRKVKEE